MEALLVNFEYILKRVGFPSASSELIYFPYAAEVETIDAGEQPEPHLVAAFGEPEFTCFPG
jgi:hypothetical protein